MYRTIYNHKINEISTWILEKITQTVRKNFDQNIFLDKSLYNWIFSPKNLGIDDFIKNDDITFFYHLLRWKEEAFEPLSTLCKMFINRNLLKASNISYLNSLERLEILAFAKKHCEINNYNSEIFCGIKERSFKGFESQNSLQIWDGTYQYALENKSSLIKALMNSEHTALIIYPSEIKEQISKKLLTFQNNN